MASCPMLLTKQNTLIKTSRVNTGLRLTLHASEKPQGPNPSAKAGMIAPALSSNELVKALPKRTILGGALPQIESGVGLKCC